MKFREDYPLNAWLVDLRDIVSKRDFIEKKEALILIVEDIEEILSFYYGGSNPQEVYAELNKEGV